MLSYLFKFVTVLVVLLMFLLSCATPRFTYSNFTKVKEGMTEEEVIRLLGEPTDVTSGSVTTGGIGALFGVENLSGTNMIWKTTDGKANILFFRGKVKTKSFTNQF
jgi:cytochrome oxidase Cu insertion factor (SCO1/SenC/PrrC family)